MNKELSPIEEKILQLIFKEKVITDILVDKLLPLPKWSREMNEDLTPESAYKVARDQLRVKLNELLVIDRRD
jgi:hypothetical protein